MVKLFWDFLWSPAGAVFCGFVIVLGVFCGSWLWHRIRESIAEWRESGEWVWPEDAYRLESLATAPVRRANPAKLGRPRTRASVGSGATRARQRRERAARAAGL